MSEGDSASVERVIAETINETARGDPDALAARIVAAFSFAVPASQIRSVPDRNFLRLRLE
jgi:hypothetical protein